MNKAIVAFLVLTVLLSVVLESDAWRIRFRVRRAWRRHRIWIKRAAKNYLLKKAGCTVLVGKKELSELTDEDYQAILKYVPADEKETVLRYMREPEGFAKDKAELLDEAAQLNEDTRGLEDEIDDEMARELAKYVQNEDMH